MARMRKPHGEANSPSPTPPQAAWERVNRAANNQGNGNIRGVIHAGGPGEIAETDLMSAADRRLRGRLTCRIRTRSP